MQRWKDFEADEGAGYEPVTGSLLTGMDVEQKEQILCYHSEKWAFAFWLINASLGTPICVSKNL
jgi:hypothetical protein